MAAVYRLRQGIRALLAFSQPVDRGLAARHLTPALLALFDRMQRSEQLHSLRVLRAVLTDGADTPPALAIAALLHDCGKSRYPLSVAQKSTVVLTRRFDPGRYARLSAGEADDPRARPFVVYVRHPAWSAEAIAAAGAPADAVWLAAHHQDRADRHRDHPLHAALRRLQRADDLN